MLSDRPTLIPDPEVSETKEKQTFLTQPKSTVRDTHVRRLVDKKRIVTHSPQRGFISNERPMSAPSLRVNQKTRVIQRRYKRIFISEHIDV